MHGSAVKHPKRKQRAKSDTFFGNFIIYIHVICILFIVILFAHNSCPNVNPSYSPHCVNTPAAGCIYVMLTIQKPALPALWSRNCVHAAFSYSSTICKPTPIASQNQQRASKKWKAALGGLVEAEFPQCSIGIQSIKREPFLPFLKAYPSLDKIRVVRSSSPFACKLLLFFFMSLLIQRMVFLALRLFLCCPAVLMFKYL